MRRTLTLVIGFWGLGIALGHHHPTSDPSTWLSRVTEKIYMIGGPGGNVGIFVGKNGMLMVDDKYAPMSKRIQALVFAVSDKPVRFIVNTHWHDDHTGGNAYFEKNGSVIFAHENVRKRMEKGQFVDAFNAQIPPAPINALPVVSFSKDIQFNIDNELIQVSHYKNAHTDGDAVIFFNKSNVIHTGDIFWNGMFPIIDASSGGTIRGTIAALEDLVKKSNDKTKFIPGHGKLGSKKDVKELLAMLKDINSQLSSLIASGKSLEEVIALNPVAKYSQFEGGIIDSKRFTEITYGVLKKELKENQLFSVIASESKQSRR